MGSTDGGPGLVPPARRSRDVIFRHRFEDRSYEEIAADLGVTCERVQQDDIAGRSTAPGGHATAFADDSARVLRCSSRRSSAFIDSQNASARKIASLLQLPERMVNGWLDEGRRLFRRNSRKTSHDPAASCGRLTRKSAKIGLRAGRCNLLDEYWDGLPARIGSGLAAATRRRGSVRRFDRRGPGLPGSASPVPKGVACGRRSFAVIDRSLIGVSRHERPTESEDTGAGDSVSVMETRATDREPSRIGKYRVMERLGSGAQAQVYRVLPSHPCQGVRPQAGTTVERLWRIRPVVTSCFARESDSGNTKSTPIWSESLIWMSMRVAGLWSWSMFRVEPRSIRG